MTMDHKTDIRAPYLVFLDIDGVFASARVHTAFDAEYAMWNKFDPIAIDFMNYIDKLYNVEFVLISTWKNNLSMNSLMTSHWISAAFANAGFRGRFAPLWKTDPDNMNRVGHTRANEILEYINTYYPDLKDYLIFDDNDYGFERVLGKKRLIKTDSENGLLYKHMIRAKSILGQWDKK